MNTDNSRRGFLKKATYAAPAVIMLGALAPTAVNAKANSAIAGLRNSIQTNRQDITNIQGRITQLQNQRDALTGPANREARQAINNEIEALRLQIQGERTDNQGLREQIRIIRNS